MFQFLASHISFSHIASHCAVPEGTGGRSLWRQKPLVSRSPLLALRSGSAASVAMASLRPLLVFHYHGLFLGSCKITPKFLELLGLAVLFQPRFPFWGCVPTLRFCVLGAMMFMIILSLLYSFMSISMVVLVAFSLPSGFVLRRCAAGYTM